MKYLVLLDIDEDTIMKSAEYISVEEAFVTEMSWVKESGINMVSFSEVPSSRHSAKRTEELLDGALCYISEVVNDPKEYLHVCECSIGMTEEELAEEKYTIGYDEEEA